MQNGGRRVKERSLTKKQKTTHIRKAITVNGACSEVSARLAKHGMELGWRVTWHFLRGGGAKITMLIM